MHSTYRFSQFAARGLQLVFVRLMAAWILIVMGGAAAGAQPTLRAGSDSAAGAALQRHLIGLFVDDIWRAAVDTAAHPWRMTIAPPGRSWRLVEAHLHRMLRARQVRTRDKRYRTLKVGPIRRSADTLSVQMDMTSRARCPFHPEEQVWVWYRTVVMVRDSSGSWGPPRDLRTMHGDSDTCPTVP